MLSWTPAADQAGPVTMVVVATDARGLTSTQTYTFTVRAVNQLPQILGHRRTAQRRGHSTNMRYEP